MPILCIILIQFWTARLDSTLSFIGLTKDDISLRNDYTKRDHYRFEIIDSLMINPLNSISFVQRLEGHFWSTCERDMLAHLADIYESYSFSKRKSDFKKGMKKSYELLSEAFSEAPLVLSEVYRELTIFSPTPTASIEEEKADEKEYDSLVTYLAENGKKVDYEKLFQASLMLLSVAEQYENWTSNLRNDSNDVDGVDGKILYYKNFGFGEVVVGDTGGNIYKRDFAVIVDLGGNDIYQMDEREGKIHILIDKSGNDQYRGDDYAIACGHLGVSILIDEKGDDIYSAKSFSIGCGAFGVGILIDKTGNDRYTGDTFTQGAGGFGVGILKDMSGQDIYEGALYAQGFASTYGIGILGDRSGNDMYIILEKYLDEIRYLDHYLSLSQGFTIGFRPDLSAGIAIIFDQEGNDYYLGDIFAQASSYWYGLGAILDNSGNDNYVAYQYAQGAGTHLTIGVLVDRGGNDNYVSKGVSQGCGHDLSLGLLLDKAGDDSYVAFDLSQGAGNANGIGILVDESGNDGYSVKRTQNTQGYGNFRREYGSIGVLLDIKGRDVYYNGGNRMLWKKGEYGIGIDWE
jgi:hypothetical protein